MPKETDKKYTAMVSLYIFAKDDEDAKEQAKRIERILRGIDDNQASVDELYEYGTDRKLMT